MQTVADIMRTVSLIRSYCREIENGEELAPADLSSISDLLEDYETMLLNLKVKE